MHTIVRIVLLSFVPTIIIHHFIFLYQSKFSSQEVFRVLRDVDDRIGAKIKTLSIDPSKKSYTQLRTNKIIQLKSNQLRKYLPNFSYSKRIPEFKILNPKNPSDHRRHLKSGVPPLEFRSTPNFLIESFAYDVLHNRKTDCRIRS